jgi:RNA polymerase sigma-70 factor (ECF subfamily)
MPHASDADLVRRGQGGDVDAIGELYDRHYRCIFRYFWLRVHDRQSAEDLTGEVFSRMVASLPDYRVTGVPFRAWLYRIARNLVADHYRKQGDHVTVPLTFADDLSAGDPGPDRVVELRLTAERVRRALARLEPAQREVVTLRFLTGLSLREVASALDKSVPAVKSLQHRGLTSLRAALNQEKEKCR